jgi:hypothetical protein
VKLGRRFLRNDNKLYFRKIKVVLPGGQAIEDDEPDADEGADAADTTQAAADPARPSNQSPTGGRPERSESSDTGTSAGRQSADGREQLFDEMERELDELMAALGA